METHIIVDLFLEYLGSLHDWSVARTLCRETRDIVRAKPYEYTLFGHRSFIQTNVCMCCDKRVEKPRWFTYKAMPLADVRFTVTCHHYHCQVSALFSMIRDLWNSKIRVLKQPFQDTREIQIPRSDGSHTSGRAIIHGLAIIRRKPYVMTQWNVGSEYFSKAVPWSHYSQSEPEFIFNDLI